MRLTKLIEDTIDYVPEVFRGGDDEPVVKIRVLTGAEVERIEEVESRRLTKKKSGYAGLAALRDAIIKAAVVSIDGLEDADSNPVRDADGLIRALSMVDASIREGVLDDIHGAIRDHSKLKAGARKN